MATARLLGLVCLLPLAGPFCHPEEDPISPSFQPFVVLHPSDTTDTTRATLHVPGPARARQIQGAATFHATQEGTGPAVGRHRLGAEGQRASHWLDLMGDTERHMAASEKPPGAVA